MILNNDYWPDLIASTGSKREAESAGIIPETTPIKTDAHKPEMIL